MTDRENDRPIRLVHCSWATGLGAGVGRMDAYFHRLLDRNRFDPVFVYLKDEDLQVRHYDPSIPYLYTGREDRFGRLLEIFSTADIVQFQGGFAPLVCETARIAQVPLLVEVLHNVEPGGAFPNINVSVCVSEAVRAVQHQSERTQVILNGIDLNDFPFCEDEKADDSIILLQVSNRRKVTFNLDELAREILPLDPRIELWLAGPDQISESTERIKFLGIQNDVASLYQQADLMVLLSDFEPFGLVAIEAMASGCLPLVSDRGGFTEIVRSGTDGWLVSPEDKDAVLENIVEALRLRDSSSWQKMRQAARKRVEEAFGADRCIRQYEELYLDGIAHVGRRTQPGPRSAEPTPEADIGDAMYCGQEKKWGEMHCALKRMANRSEPFKHEMCARVALEFARIPEAHEDTTLASSVYYKVGQSFSLDLEALKLLIQLPSLEVSDDRLIALILSHAESEEEPVILLVDRLLQEKHIHRANAVLDEAAKRSPEGSSLRRRYELWQEKLAPLLPK